MKQLKSRALEGKHPIWTQLDALTKSHAEQGARLTELRARVATMNLPAVTAYACPVCGIEFRSQAVAEQHLYVSHDGPLPQSLIAGERAAGEWGTTP